MPAPVTSTSSTRLTSKATATKPRGQPLSKKTRIVRRRGRAKDAIESDDEIEREVGTDSDSDDDLSSLDSASDSDTEPASEDVIHNGHSRVLTPSTSQSPEDGLSLDKDPVVQVNEDDPAFFATTGNWSEMVADENDNGPADLPVIDFADFDSQSIPHTGARSRKVKKPAKKARPISESASPLSASLSVAEEEDEDLDVEPVASTSHHPPGPSSPRRPAGQTARQAYQHRLESDPSYVPTVGEFWGHDDRLLDKDLRSLSGWWRGRWQGRGRGRGGFDRGFPTRGRGRGGHFGPHPSFPNHDASTNDAGDEETQRGPPDLQPIDRAWTHDGFEEMKRRDEHRRGFQSHQQQDSQQFRGASSFRGGRGGFIPSRGRGGFTRGGFTSSPTRSRGSLPFVPPAGRPWFAMKPERMWTKQHDGFLHFDPALKPRPGQGPGIRVKLPGDRVQIVRAPPRTYPSTQPSIAKPATASILGSDYGENSFVVRLPKRVHKEKATKASSVATAEEPITTVEDPPIEDVFTVRPRLAGRNPNPLSQPATASTVDSFSATYLQPQGILLAEPLKHPEAVAPKAIPESTVQQQLEQLSVEPQTPDPARWAQTEEAVLRHPPTAVEQPSASASEQRPPLPPLQTAFTPPVSSPTYSSPYGYGPVLPPGIAINQHGMPYELATGRPVYLQTPLPPMFNPRPLMHTHVPPSVPFVPGHGHHHSAVSPDFLAQPPSHTPPINGFLDPSTGTPIFSFPRQSSRIEIRAPSEQNKSSGKPSARRPSGLRTAAATFEPSRPSNNPVQSYFPSMTEPADTEMLHSYTLADGADGSVPSDDGHATQHQQVLDPTLMGYSPYQQQYYYPDSYGYPPYMDMSQVGQYEMYPSDPRAPQGTVYY